MEPEVVREPEFEESDGGIADFKDLEIDALCEQMQATDDKDETEHLTALIDDLEKRLGRGHGAAEKISAVDGKTIDDDADQPF